MSAVAPADGALWREVNRRLLAKLIGECCYEECLRPVSLADGRHRLPLASGVEYRFRARPSIWSWPRVEAEGIERDGAPALSPLQLAVDAQEELGMTGIVLGSFLQELQNTLYADLRRRRALARWTAAEMAELPGPRLQLLLDGHPKAAANKGRIGWGEDALSAYAPEAGESFRLHWVAVERSLCGSAFAADADPRALLRESLSESEMEEVEARMARHGLGWENAVCIPVHPWQWQQYVLPQYAEHLATGRMLELGVHGDRYLPQQSLRTLSNATRPERCDVKLALTVLNTSCYRGIPGEHIRHGTAFSEWLCRVAEEDGLLRGSGLVVQRELGGVHAPHPYQEQVRGTPYRFNELLGCVWRESLEARLGPGERSVLMSALMQTDAAGRALVAEYVARSGLEAEAWLSRLFDVVVVPLYHLLCRYGLGLIAHGQNVSLVLDGYVPGRAAVKDFHGDLRRVDRDFPELATMPAGARGALARLPPEHLVHDLVTGHFVTTLRFVSPLVEEQCGVPETRFYALLAERVRAYQAEHPQLADRFALFPLLESEILRVCINRARFRVGYEDSAVRPLPELGTPLANPLLAG